jgi:flagellar assembly protein FliH
MSDAHDLTAGTPVDPDAVVDKHRSPARERKPRVISADSLSAYERWELPVVDGTSLRSSGLTAQQLETLQKQAYDEGFAQGQRDGMAQMQARAQEFMRLMAALQEPFRELDEQVEQELVLLAVAIARQVVRRELKTDPGTVVAVVREALGQLPVAARQISVHLHPEDAQLVRAALSVGDEAQRWRVMEDAMLARGDARVVTETSRVDATLEARLAAISAALLGGERQNDRSDT